MDNFKPSKLTMISGGPQPNQAFVLSQIETTIGRIQPADILIEDAIISRQHARITLQGEQYFLEDLGSSNGTFLNGQPVVTNGITKPTLLKTYKMGAQLDDLTQKGAAKDLLGREFGVEHRAELTEEAGERYVRELVKRVNQALESHGRPRT